MWCIYLQVIDQMSKKIKKMKRGNSCNECDSIFDDFYDQMANKFIQQMVSEFNLTVQGSKIANDNVEILSSSSKNGGKVKEV